MNTNGWTRLLLFRRRMGMDWAGPILILVIYVVLMRWVLPHFGVPT